MKKALLFFVLFLGCACVAAYFSAPYALKRFATKALNDMGYKGVQISGLKINLDTVTAVKLQARSADGKLIVEGLTAKYTLSFPYIEDVNIERLVAPYSIQSDNTAPQHDIQINPATIPNIFVKDTNLKLNINNSNHSIDIKEFNLTSVTDIKVGGDVSYKDDAFDASATLDATLTSLSDYTATLTLNTLEVNSPAPIPVFIKRGFGWLNLSQKPHEVLKASSELTFGVFGLAGASLNSVTTNLSTNDEGLYTLSIEGSGLDKTAELSLFVETLMAEKSNIKGHIDFTANDLSTLNTAFPDEDLPNMLGALALKGNFDISDIDKSALKNIEQWSGGIGLSASLKDVQYDTNIKNINAAVKAAFNFKDKSLSLTAPSVTSNLAKLYDLKGVGKIENNATLNLILDGSGIDNLYKIHAKAKLDIDTPSYQIDYTLTPKRSLSLKGMNTLLKPFNQKLSDYSGAFKLHGVIKPTLSKHVLALQDINAVQDGINLKGLNGVVTLLNGNVSNQDIFIAGLDLAGLPLKNGLINFDYKGTANTLRIKSMDWTLTGGSITSSPFDLNLDTMNTEFTLTAKKLNLADVFNLAPLDGLKAEGSVGGSIPVIIKNGVVRVDDANLAAIKDGVIKYDPLDVPAFLQTDNKQMQILREALKDYNFETLELSISGESGKEQKIVLKAMGSNPEFYEGRDVKLNLNLEGALDNLLKFNVGTYKIPDKIKQQLNAFED